MLNRWNELNASNEVRSVHGKATVLYVLISLK